MLLNATCPSQVEVEVSINGDSAGKQDRLFKVGIYHNHECSLISVVTFCCSISMHVVFCWNVIALVFAVLVTMLQVRHCRVCMLNCCGVQCINKLYMPVFSLCMYKLQTFFEIPGFPFSVLLN